MRNWFENTVTVKLPPKPHTADELELAGKIALNKPNFDMAMDCSKIGLATCSALCGFMKLRKILTSSRRRLLFYNVGPVTKGVFSIYGFDQIFEIFDDRMKALGSLQNSVDDETPASANTEGSKRPQRRNYIRLDVCGDAQLDVLLWHKTNINDNHRIPPVEDGLQGRLLDISLGGARIGVDATERHDFRKKQTIRLKFTPYQTSLVFDAVIKAVQPAADGQGISLGLQFVGLEANSEGRRGVDQLCKSTERYYQTAEFASSLL